MRLSIPKTSEIVLAALALAFLAALVIPWRQPDAGETLLKGSAEAAQASAGVISEPVLATPEVLNNLFVAKRTAAPAAAPKPASPASKKAVSVPWLRYIGTISGAEGKTYYFFKDTRTNRSITLSAGETVNGWSLLETGDKQFILKNNEDLYTVNKR